MLRRILTILICMILLVSCSACGKHEEPEPEPEPEIVEPEPEPEPEPMPWDLFAYNKLTGLYDVDKEHAGMRPVAVMVNNNEFCLPQRGLSDCDLLVEIEVEGGITRTMAVFTDYYKVREVGPVRSLRNQFLDLARPMDAIILHVGSSYYADEAAWEYGYRTSDAMSSYNVFQDESRLDDYAWEHTWFTDIEHISGSIESLDLRTEDESPEPIFNFAPYGTEAAVDDGWALGAEWEFSYGYDSRIQYSRNAEAYMFWQHGDIRIDELDGKPFYFPNVFILTAYRPGFYDGTSSPRYDYSEGGYGYYLYKGMYEEFTWTKDSDEDRMTFWDSDGNKLLVNPGRSYVAIINTYEADTLKFDDPPFDVSEPEETEEASEEGPASEDEAGTEESDS